MLAAADLQQIAEIGRSVVRNARLLAVEDAVQHLRACAGTCSAQPPHRAESEQPHGIAL